MSEHNFLKEFGNADWHIPDPGTAKALPPSRTGIVNIVTGASGQTNTLAAPVKEGLILGLNLLTDGGGDRVITVASAYDAAGRTTITLATAGDYIVLMSYKFGSVFRWRVLTEQLAANASQAEVNAAADATGRVVNVTNATTYAVLAADSGKVHVMPDFTSTCTLTLPTAATGLSYLFISKAVAADAQNWVFDTGAAANFYLGGLAFADTDAGAAGDEIHAGVWPNGSTNDIMTIVTPGAGTRIQLICDGTNWIVSGVVFSATVPTFADT
jgi:hypothetical protein